MIHRTLTQLIDIMYALEMKFHRLYAIMIQGIQLAIVLTIPHAKSYNHHLQAVFRTLHSPFIFHLMTSILKYIDPEFAYQ